MTYESSLPDETPTDMGFRLSEMTTAEALEYLRDAAKELEDGAEIIVRVPDFDAGVKAYQERQGKTEEMILRDGKSRSIWNGVKLLRALNSVGLEPVGTVDGKFGEGGILSVLARKLPRPEAKLPMTDIRAVMSMPRVSWTTTNHVLHQAAAKLGIDTVRVTGVFWGQCLERVMEQAAKDGMKYILTVDYDSVFDAEDIVRLWQIMETRPDVDALCPMQIQRDKENCLFTMTNADGSFRTGIDERELFTDALPMHTGHFGLTMIRTSALEGIKRPLFHASPAPDGTWGDGRTDDDINFWNLLRSAGRKICLCPRVKIGHLQLVISWPDENNQALHQYFPAYSEGGRPPCTVTF